MNSNIKESLKVNLKFNGSQSIQGNMAKNIYNAFINSGKKELIIFNIGSDSTIGDSLGPFIGTMLKDRNIKLKTMGTLDNPINGKNVESKIDYVRDKYPNAFILATDAALSDYDDLGIVVLRNQPIKPGAGLDKKLNTIGDYSIIAIVNRANLGFKGLANTRISFVMNIAKNIVQEIILLEKLINNKEHISSVSNTQYT